MNEQLELNVGVSKRVRLLPDAEPKLVIDVEGEVTEWFTGEPPCSGWWEVCFAGEKLARHWYNKDTRTWSFMEGLVMSVRVSAAEHPDLRWRGLKAPSHQMFIHTETANRLKRVKLLN